MFGGKAVDFDKLFVVDKVLAAKMSSTSISPKAALLAGHRSDNSMNAGEDGADGIAGAKEALNRAQALQQRGEKLNQLGEKTERLQNAAKNLRMPRKTRLKQEAASKFWKFLIKDEQINFYKYV